MGEVRRLSRKDSGSEAGTAGRTPPAYAHLWYTVGEPRDPGTAQGHSGEQRGMAESLPRVTQLYLLLTKSRFLPSPT